MQEDMRQEPAVKGHYKKVAVGCWFTSTGRAIPQMLKYEDEEGVRHTIGQIQVRKTNQEQAAGFLLQRYECSALIYGTYKTFYLLYHPGENTWDMVLP